MKKHIPLALVLPLFLILTACSSNSSGDSGGDISGGSTISSGGNNSGDSTVNGDGIISDDGDSVTIDVDEDTFYFDRETIEMFGGMNEFIKWLRDDLGLDAEDFYESVYGEYYNSPVEKVSEERGWLDGYRTNVR